jgi:signal transduction histidine kinase
MASLLRRGLPGILFFALYIILAAVGLRYASLPGDITLIWPLSGVVLTALITKGLRLAWVVFLADVCVGLWIGASPLVALFISLGTTMEALLAAWVVRRICHEHPEADRLRDILAILAAAAIGPIAGASIATSTLILAGEAQSTDFQLIWLGWWAADAVGMLFVTPLLLAWSSFQWRMPTGMQFLETALLSTSAALLTVWVFNENLNSSYILFVVAIWAALRFSIRGVTIFLAVGSLMTILQTLFGSGPFVRETTTISLIFLQTFLAVLCATTLILHALTNESRRSAAAVRLLADISDLTSTAHNLDAMLSQVAARLTRSYGSACIIELQELHHHRRRVAAVGLDRIHLDGVPIAETAWLQHQIDATFQTHQPYWVNQFEYSLLEQITAYLRRTPELQGQQARSVMIMPLGMPGQTIGVIALFASSAARRYRACDLTTMRELDSQLARTIQTQQLQSYLMQSQRFEALGRMAGGVAHDFNNLLMLIRGNLDLARDTLNADSPVQRELLQIDEITERAGRLVRQLLVVGQKQRIEVVPTALLPFVEQLKPLIERLLNDSILIEYHLSNQDLSILVDPTQFEQVLMNLVVNARDAMPAGGNLRLETGTHTLDAGAAMRYGITAGQYALLTISDTGEGIPNDIMHRIFEPFFTTKDSKRGTGLGLAICQSIVRQCGGCITITSQVGAGTSVHVFLPLALQKTHK